MALVLKVLTNCVDVVTIEVTARAGTGHSGQRSVKNNIKHLYLGIFVAMFECQLGSKAKVREFSSNFFLITGNSNRVTNWQMQTTVALP